VTNKDIEKRYQTAYSHAVPDVFDKVLAECEKEDQQKTIVLETPKIIKPMWRKMMSVAAAIAVILTSGFAGFMLSKIDVVDSIISFDVNPSIEIKVNQKEQVIDAFARNADGEVVLGGMNLKGSDLTVAVNAIVGSMLRNGYIDELSNSILISVQNQNSKRGQALESRISEEIDRLLSAYAIDGAVISQILNNEKRAKEMAEKYGITEGKAQLILQITDSNKTYTFKDLAPLTINELVLLTSNDESLKSKVNVKGKASEKRYIGKSNAKKKALKQENIGKKDIFDYSCEFKYQDGQMVYKIHFKTTTAKYDYVLKATSGKILKAEIERGNFANPQLPENMPTDAPVITDETVAQSIAFNMVGVTEDDISNYVCTYFDFAEVPYYNVTFFVGEVEYSYNLNAQTGELIPESTENDTSEEEISSDVVSSDITSSVVSTPADSSQNVSSQDLISEQMVIE
jgi:hypothetical protein